MAVSFVAVPSLARAQAASSPQTIVVEDQNADKTRDALEEVLKRYPPSLAYVLKLDPALLSNQPYLAPYPVLQQFLTKHPEVVRAPKYYFDEYTVRDGGGDPYSEFHNTPEQRAIDMWRSNIEGFTFLLGFLSVIGALTWIIKSIVDHRRWGRQAKVQAEVHNKVIDRLASNEEMLAYVQSPAGSGFLKGGPAMLVNGSAASRIMGAPYNRILWSAQAGVVFLALGLGFRWVNVSAPSEVLEMLHFFGLIGMSLGIGFLASAILSYGISWKLGLLAPPTPERTPTSHS
jgi:hypothetical protein